MMHGRGKSDSAIVAMKPANKAEQSAAEPVERRAGTKRNASQHDTHRTPSRASVTHGLERIRQSARERRDEKFTALLHHVSTDLLEAEFFALKEHAAPGVDGLTWRDYEQNLEGNLADLHARSIEGPIGRSHPDGSTSPNRMDGSVRWRSPRWRTRSSSGQSQRC